MFSHHRTVLAAVLCLEKGQRDHLLVEQHESCPGASWSSAAIWVFLPPTAWSDPQLQIHRLCPKSSHSKCQQGDCHPMRIWLEGTFGSHSLSHSPGLLPMLSQVCCGFVQQKLEPPPRVEVPPNPSGVLPQGCTFSPRWSFSTSQHPKPQFVIFASYYSTSHHQGEFGSVIFSSCPSRDWWLLLHLPPGHASTLLLALKVWHSSQRRSHLPPGHASILLLALKVWHSPERGHQEDPAGCLWALSISLSAGIASICKQAT